MLPYATPLVNIADCVLFRSRALGTKNDARYNLKIVNTDEEGGNSSAQSSLERHTERDSVTGDARGEAPKDSAGEAEDRFGEERAAQPFAEESHEVDEPTSDLAEQTRAELADYDDLDI